jgi:sugar lactone lactonase YvrE
MRAVTVVLAIAIALGVAYLFLLPFWVHPVAWTHSPDPGWTGVFAPSDSTPVFEIIPTPPGPEDVALGPDGLLYIGIRDGRIVRLAMDGSGLEDVAVVPDRPLGLGFDAQGGLIVAARRGGLLRVAPGGEVTLLADRADGTPIGFADDLDIGADGVVWFSDLTTRFPNDPPMDYWEGTASGRLLAWDPATGTTTVRAAGLRYPNGVALGPGARYILVCETLTPRITRIWIAGPRAGEREAFVEELPGYVDNITYDGHGSFWVGLVGTRVPAFERHAGRPWLRRLMARVPGVDVPRPMPWYPDGESGGCVIEVDTTGTVRASLHDPARRYDIITSANRYADSLFLGSISHPGIAVIRLPAAYQREFPE